MPGLALTNEFMLGTATVMIGAADDLYDLNPDEHSIGLVKNFTCTSEPAYTELTQGVKNTIVHSTLTANPIRATMEAYEYTAKNFAYALGLEGAETLAVNTVETTLSAPVDGGSPAQVELEVTSATGLTVGAYIMIIVDSEDHFVVRKITEVNGTTLTVNRALPDIASGAVVKKVHDLGVGSKTEQPFYSAQVAGKLANGEEVVLMIPKLRIVRGFNLGFVTDDYGNLPLEFTLYDPVPTDTFYADFGGNQALLFRK